MSRCLSVLVLLCVILMLSSPTLAGQEQNDAASISLHIGPWVSKQQCDTAPVLTAATMTTQACGPMGDYYMLYLLVCNASDSLGVAGLEYGIDYNGVPTLGVDINAWYSCTDLEFPSTSWPMAGTGNLQTWDYTVNCQNTLSEPYVPRTVIAIAGVFDVVVWSPDQFIVTPRPVSGRAKIGDCFGAEYDITGYVPSHLGVAGFCLPGYNPCGAPTPVQPTTWGLIKRQY